MSDIAISFSADEKDVTKALQNLIKENAKLRAEITTGVEESKKAAAQEREWQKLREKTTKEATAQMQQLNASAQRIKDSLATPFDEAKKKVAELRDHLQAGRLTTDEYRAAYAKVGKELKEATRDHAAEAEALAKSKAAEKAHTQAINEAAAVADKYATKEERVAKELARLNALKAQGVLSSKDYARAVEAENKKLSDSTDKFSGAMKTMTAIGVGSVGFLQQMASKLKELQEEMASSAKEFDGMSRKFGIQGGLNDAERKVQSKLVGGVALQAGVGIDKAFETATQLSSSGFADPVKGGTLNTALALMQSSNQIDGNAAEFIKGSGQFMNAFGMQKNQANLADLGIRMQGLFKTTDVQAADLPEFAKAAPVLSGAGLNLEQSLSTLTALRESMNAGEAATGARNVVLGLQSAGGNKSAREALGSVGLKPEQVDIAGEGLQKSLETLNIATAQIGEAEKAIVLSKVFGKENIAAASILMDSTGKFDQYAGMQRAAGGQFEKDVATARNGISADAARAQVSKIMDAAENEDAIRQQELARQARIDRRDKFVKGQMATGGLLGRAVAGARAIEGLIEDNVVYPVFGEHPGELDRLTMQKLAGNGKGSGVLLPPALRNAAPVQGGGMNQAEAAQVQQAILLQKQLDLMEAEKAAAADRLKEERKERAEQKRLLKEAKDAEKLAAHAGVVAARGMQMEGRR